MTGSLHASRTGVSQHALMHATRAYSWTEQPGQPSIILGYSFLQTGQAHICCIECLPCNSRGVPQSHMPGKIHSSSVCHVHHGSTHCHADICFANNVSQRSHPKHAHSTAVLTANHTQLTALRITNLQGIWRPSMHSHAYSQASENDSCLGVWGSARRTLLFGVIMTQQRIWPV